MRPWPGQRALIFRYVQKTMGHSTPTVTANIYADLYEHELDAVADFLDRLAQTGHEPDTQFQPGSEAS